MNKQLELVRKRLSHFTLKWQPTDWLDTTIPELNRVLGHRDKGLAYGRIIELSGWECLTGDTFIDCPRDLTKYPQGIPIQDLVGKTPWVYSYDQTEERIVLRRASKVWKVGRRAVYKITFRVPRNSVRVYGKGPEYILATESHPFMLREQPPKMAMGDYSSKAQRIRSGPYEWKSLGYKCVKDLKPGDRIMPLFRKRVSSGRESILRLNNGTSAIESRFVLSEIKGERDPSIWDAHHRDENHLNNDPSNLEWKTKHKHISEHTTARNLAGTAGWQKTGIHPRGMLGKPQTAKQKKRASECTRKRWEEFRRQKQLNHVVKKVEFYGYEDVYDMTVPGTDNFVANGVVVHNSQGKTSITLSIAAMGQYNGAYIVWVDAENSFDADYAIQRGFAKCPKCKANKFKIKSCTLCNGEGLDFEKLILIRPYVGKFAKEKEERLSNAQELCSEAEEVIKALPRNSKTVLVVDSVAALMTEGESAVNLEGINQKGKRVGGMRTNLSLPVFIGQLLRRWVGMSQVRNVLTILVNQLRTSPVKGFGDSSYTTGGNAPRFYAHARARVHRVKGSKMTDKGKYIGFKGVIVSKKNKTGGTEGYEVGFRLFFDGRLEFVAASEVKSESKEEE